MQSDTRADAPLNATCLSVASTVVCDLSMALADYYLYYLMVLMLITIYLFDAIPFYLLFSLFLSFHVWHEVFFFSTAP